MTNNGWKKCGNGLECEIQTAMAVRVWMDLLRVEEEVKKDYMTRIMDRRDELARLGDPLVLVWEGTWIGDHRVKIKLFPDDLRKAEIYIETGTEPSQYIAGVLKNAGIPLPSGWQSCR